MLTLVKDSDVLTVETKRRFSNGEDSPMTVCELYPAMVDELIRHLIERTPNAVTQIEETRTTVVISIFEGANFFYTHHIGITKPECESEYDYGYIRIR